MMPSYRDGWTMENPTYMQHRSEDGAKMEVEE